MSEVEVDKLKMVCVDWVDSEGDSSGGWLHLEDIGNDVTHIRTVGMVVTRDKKNITIVSSLDEGNGNYLGRITIPICAIVGMKELCPNKSARRSRPRRTQAPEGSKRRS